MPDGDCVTKKTVWVAAAALVLIVAALLAIPLLIDANQFRPTMEAKLSQALGRQVKIGSLKLTILSGAVAADDRSIPDDPAFNAAPFLHAGALKAQIRMAP